MSFEVGDRVIHLLYGYGTITDVYGDNTRIWAVFDDGKVMSSFYIDGKYSRRDKFPILYHAEGFVPPSAPEPERCPFKEGDAVLVRNSKENTWQVHKFIKMTLPERRFVTTCGNEITYSYKYCIPLKGNEQLIDSNIEPEDDNAN